VVPSTGSSLPLLAALVAVLGAAFGLRVFELPDAGIWYDEGLAVWAARQSLLAMARWTAGDVHPPLYFALLHVWRLGVGDSEFALRFLSVGFGTLAVALLWKLGRIVVPQQPVAAVLGAGFLALSAFNVWWSQETRMYALGSFLVALNLLSTVKLSRRWERRWIAAWLIATVAALWTLYLLAFLLAVDGLYWLGTLRDHATSGSRKRLFARWAGLEALAVLAFVPWLVVALRHTRSWSVETPISFGGFFHLYATLLALGQSTNVDDYTLPTAVIAGIAFLGVVAILLRSSSRSAVERGAPQTAGAVSGLVLLALSLLLPAAIVWVVTNVPRSIGYAPRTEARYLLPYSVGFDLLLAWSITALASLGKRWTWLLGFGLVGVVGILQVVNLQSYYADRIIIEDYQSITQTIRAYDHPGDLVVLHTNFGWPVFSYYWPEGFTGLSPAVPFTADRVNGELGPLWAGHDGVWLVVDDDALRADPSREVERWFASRATASTTWRYGSKRLILFARTAARASTLSDLAPGFTPRPPAEPLKADGDAIVGWDQALPIVRSGQEAHGAVYVQRTGAGGQLTVQLGVPKVSGATVQIPPGQGLVRLPISVNVPLGAPTEATAWQADLGGASATLGKVDIVGSGQSVGTPTAVAVTPSHPADAIFGDPPLAQLIGYDLSPVVPGQDAHVTLYWKAEAGSTLSYKVFVHLLDQAGAVVAQRDDYPVHGTRPTTTWQAGETIVDQYDLAVPATAKLAGVTLELGLYDPSTGDRLGPVASQTLGPQSGNRLLLRS
jgi:uncharacterized membrane protein